MKSNSVKVNLTLNGKKVTVGHQFLKYIAGDIPDVDENKKAFELLSQCDNFEVKEKIARNESLNKKTISILLNDDSEMVVDNILSNSTVAKKITNKQLMKIVAKGNIEHICTIAENIEDYQKCDSCKLVDIFSSHKNPLVRASLVKWRSSDIVPTNILIKLSHDNDIEIAKEAKAKLSRRSR